MDSLGTYLGRRALQALPLIVAAAVFNFFLIHAAPGDPALMLAGESGSATPEFVDKLRQDFGLDRPLAEQLLVYLGKLAQGDLGFSYRQREPVLALALSRLPATLLLMTAGFGWALIGGIVLGVLAARRAGTWLGSGISALSLVAYATPLFWFGLMLVVIFGIRLQWLPTHGMITIGMGHTGLAYVRDVLAHLLLPAATLGLFYLALYTRFTRTSMIEVLSHDFIVVARAKGLSERSVVYRHALRNAMLGVATIAGMQLGQILGGSVLVETIFAWPGMGRLLFEAVFQRDYPVLLGVLLLSSVAVIVMNVVTDLVYGVLDPRIRHR
jgi:peptide/nickel transport system permease protein